MTDLYSDIPWFTAFTTYFGYALLMIIGAIRDWFGFVFRPNRYRQQKGYAPILRDFEDFYTRRLYHRIQDCWNRPITSSPDSWIDVVDRKFVGPQYKLEDTGKTKHCLNLGSYNYLGFGGKVEKAVYDSVDTYGPATAATRSGGGGTTPLVELEGLVARFLGKEAALVLGMGFATNSMLIPALVGKGGLIISDELNHASVVTGSRSTSGAKVKVFRHNDMAHLEQVLRQSIVEGQPRTHRPWKKIIIIVEGIYSMEGETCNLPAIVELKKKYKAYLYVDEAHSIGALGASGRGVCEYFGVPTSDVDILMGTFTKSFGSVGGYIAGSQQLINHLRRVSPGVMYSEGMSAPCVQQVICSLKCIMGEDGSREGKKKIAQLRDNAMYFRKKLQDMGVITLGSEDSPVIPMMLYTPSKIAAFSRECFARGLAVVVVGFPATPLLLSRARFCVSAAHTRKDMDFALEKINEVADLIRLKYAL